MNDSFEIYYKRRLENLDYQRMKSIINNRDIYIWGADKKGTELECILNRKAIFIKGFIDAKIKDLGEKEVYQPDVLNKITSKDSYILVSMKLRHEKEVCDSLREHGFIENQDYYYPYKNISHVWRDLGTRREVIYDERYSKGKRIAEELDEDKIYFILLGGHIGDAALALSWIKPYKEKHFVKSITILSLKKYYGLATLYADENDEVVVYPFEELDCLRVYSLAKERNHYNFIGSNYCWIPLEKGIPFHVNQVIYKTMHLDLDYSVKSVFLKDISDRSDVVEIIRKNKIRKGKAIVLVPYSQSSLNLSMSFWEKLAEKLTESFQVYTNVGPNENAIINTTPLVVPLETLPAIVNYAGHAITIRCGIADILALGECKGMICLHYSNSEMWKNYARVNSMYVNEKDSYLYSNSLLIESSEDEQDYIELLYRICLGEKKIERNL